MHLHPKNPTTTNPTQSPLGADETRGPSSNPTSSPTPEPITAFTSTAMGATTLQPTTAQPTTSEPTTASPTTSEPTTTTVDATDVCPTGTEATTTAGPLSMRGIICSDDNMFYLDIDYSAWNGAKWFGLVFSDSMFGQAAVYTTGKNNDLTVALYAYTNTDTNRAGVNRNTDVDWTEEYKDDSTGLRIIYSTALGGDLGFSLTTESIPIGYAIGTGTNGLDITVFHSQYSAGFELSFPTATPSTTEGGFDICNSAKCKYIAKIILKVLYSFADDSTVDEDNFIALIITTFKGILGAYISEENIEVTVILTDTNAAASEGNIEITSNVGIASDALYDTLSEKYDNDEIQDDFISTLSSDVDSQWNDAGFVINIDDVISSEFEIIDGTAPTTTDAEEDDETRPLWAFVHFDFVHFTLYDWIVFGGAILFILLICFCCCWCINKIRLKKMCLTHK